MSIRSLGKQTLIYGIGTILARIVTFLLLPLYTNVFTTEEYGVVALAYAFIGFTIMLYRYGMDAALMKYYVEAKGEEKKKYFTIIFVSQILTSIMFSGVLYVFSSVLAPIFLGGDYEFLMQLVAVILFFDALWMLPLLILRAEEKPRHYILLSLLNVVLLMSLNIYLVVYKGMGIQGVLIGNIVASGILLLATLPIIFRNIRISLLDKVVLKQVLRFGLPFFPAGIFTMIMELSDRYLLEWMTNTALVGIYSAGNKLGMFGMLMVMGFNMGWMPYFLKIGKQKDAPIIFARIATYFLGISGFFIVLISLWIDYVVRINIGNVTVFGSEFWSSTRVVPLILLGYYFSGLFVLQLPGVFILNKTKWMPIMRGSGAIVSITANLILIPIFDITGAAMAKALAYFCMATAIYIMTRNIYPIPFRPRSILFPIVFMLIIIAVPLSNELRLLITILYPVLWFLLVAEKTDIEKIKSLYRKK